MDLNKHHCSPCGMPFKTNKCLQKHLKCKRHTDRINKITNLPSFVCDTCGKKYSHRQSLHTHKLSCVPVIVAVPVVATSIQELLQQQMEEMKLAFEKERQEMKLAFEESMKEQINRILETHAGSGTTTNNNNSNSHNIGTQNVNININAFGHETTDYLDDRAIMACIGRVYKSIPSLLEKLHFDPKHPEHHNIKITNKKLPYASVMGNNQKWKTVDRKDAIEKMVLNSYNMLDEKYTENKDKFSTQKQQNFEGFQTKFEAEDKDTMKQIKTEVDMMVINGY
jgi:hypothetical protein